MSITSIFFAALFAISLHAQDGTGLSLTVEEPGRPTFHIAITKGTNTNNRLLVVENGDARQEVQIKTSTAAEIERPLKNVESIWPSSAAKVPCISELTWTLERAGRVLRTCAPPQVLREKLAKFQTTALLVAQPVEQTGETK